MARLEHRRQRIRNIAVVALSTSALLAPAAAYAQCSQSGTTYTCTGTTTSFSTNSTANAAVTVNSGATVIAPVTIQGDSSTLTNAGSITNTGAYYAVTMGTNATVTNTGSITSTGTSSGSGAIYVGDGSTVTNSGTLTAYSGTPVVTFGTNGTFNNTTSAATAVTGNIYYGSSTSSVSANGTFKNENVSYGFTGNVYSYGGLTFNNQGLYSGNVYMYMVSNSDSVAFTNGTLTSGGTYDTNTTFTGIYYTQGGGTFVNNGTAYLYTGSTIGSNLAYQAGNTATVTNNGILYVGTTAAPAQLTIYGNYVQSSSGTLNIAIIPAGASTTSAGTNYSQLYTTGTATLSGTLNVNVTAGFYKDGTTFNVVDALKGITNNGATFTVNSGSPPIFLNFTSLGVQTVSGTEQAYQVEVTHNGYASTMTSLGGSANQIAVAGAFDYKNSAKTTGLLATANANPAGDEATLLGQLDVLDLNDAKVALNTLSPEGYLAYASALRDQANAFARQVDLRMTDQNSKHPEDGWWFNFLGAFDTASTASTTGGYRTRDHLFGVYAGYDLSGPHHVIGIAASISWDSLHYALNSLTGTNRDFAFAVYGAQNFGALRLSGQLAYNLGHMSATHTTTLGDYTRTGKGKAGENMFKATAQLGYDVKLGGYKLEPFVGIDFNKGQVNSFTETDAGAANLTVGAIKADRTEALFGASVNRDHGVFRPYLKALYREKISGSDATTVSAYLDGDNSTAFSVNGLGLGKGEFDANAGINWVFDDAGALFVGYQGTYRSSYQSHGISLGLRLEF